uniref:Uncharacterized protein n=1 Tax=Arundo donax TaxID=35708 RepID=A0A0A8YKR9_ARUDO
MKLRLNSTNILFLYLCFFIPIRNLRTIERC